MFDGVLIPLLRKTFWVGLAVFFGSFLFAFIGIVYESSILLKSAFALGIGSLLLLCFTTAYQRYVKCPSCHRPFFGSLSQLYPWRSRCAYCDRQL